MNKIHSFYTTENYKKTEKNNTYSYLRNWLYFQHNLEKYIVKLILKNIHNISEIKNILDIWWWEWDNIFFLSKIFSNYENLYLLDYSNIRLEKAKLKYNSVKTHIWDMRELQFDNNKFDLVTCFVSLMFLNNIDDINKTLSWINKVLKKWWFLLINEKYVKKWHFNWRLKQNWFEWYNVKELNYFLEKNWFEKVGKSYFFNKTFFWKGIFDI